MKKSIIAVALLCAITTGCASTSNETKQPQAETNTSVLSAVSSAVVDSAKTAAQNAAVEKAASNPLISNITSQLGLTQSQAEGGLSSLLGFAQSQMPESQFEQVSQGIPGIDSLLAVAPDFSDVISKSDTGNSALSGLMNTVNQGNQMMALVTSFQENGLSADLIQPMVQILLSFLTEEKEEDTAGLSQLASLFKI